MKRIMVLLILLFKIVFLYSQEIESYFLNKTFTLVSKIKEKNIVLRINDTSNKADLSYITFNHDSSFVFDGSPYDLIEINEQVNKGKKTITIHNEMEDIMVIVKYVGKWVYNKSEGTLFLSFFDYNSNAFLKYKYKAIFENAGEIKLIKLE